MYLLASGVTAVLAAGTTDSFDCEFNIPNGRLAVWCTADSYCPYFCNFGYKKNPKVSMLYCSTDELERELLNDGISLEDLCLPRFCQNRIPNGNLSETCAGTVGSKCEYFCDEGYRKSMSVSTITCQRSQEWDLDLHSLCTSNQQCPYEIPHGDLDLSCRRVPEETCSFTCDINYVPTPSLLDMKITCASTLLWNHPLTSLCQNIECPAVIPNGIISLSCHRKTHSVCLYYHCNNGYLRRSQTVYLICNANGQWEWRNQKEDLCIKRNMTTTTTSVYPTLCPSHIPNGYISYSCDRYKHSSCAYTCDLGCSERYTSLYCSRSASWNNKYSACKCYKDKENGQKTLSKGVVLAIVAGICSFIMFVFCGICCKRRRQGNIDEESPRYQEHTTRSTRIDTRMYVPGHISHVRGQEDTQVPLQQQNNTETGLEIQPQSETDQLDHDQGPPEYNTLLMPEPSVAPPSYEQAISNPSRFKVS